MKRLAAVVVAAAMIVGSLYVRSRIDHDGGSGSSTTTSGARRVVCSTELAAACDALGGGATVEDAGTTADRLVAAKSDPGLDVWIVPAPWPELVDIRRDQAGRDPLFGRAVTVAHTRLGLVTWKGRVDCPPPITWRCLGEKGAKVGHADPGRDGIGLLVLAHAVASFFGRADLSTADLDDPGFDAWFSSVEQRGTANDDALDLLFSSHGVLFAAVGVTEIEVRDTVERAADRDKVEVTYPAPMARAGALVAGRRGVEVEPSLRTKAADALVGAGWERGGASAGLPDAGFLDALLARWREVAR